MAAITTIPVRPETKEILEPLKGNRTWDEFLRELAEMKREKMREDLKKLARVVDPEKVKRAESWAR